MLPPLSRLCRLKGRARRGGQLSSRERNLLGCPFPGQLLCRFQPGCLRLPSLGGAHQKPAGVSHHSFSEFNQEKEKTWRAGSPPLSLLTGVSSARPWGDGSEPVCKGRRGWQREDEKMGCIKIHLISQHAEKTEWGGKGGKGREHGNLGRPARLWTPEKAEGLLPQTAVEEGLHCVSVTLVQRAEPWFGPLEYYRNEGDNCLLRRDPEPAWLV